MARRRSVVRRAGAGRQATPALLLAVVLVLGGLVLVGLRVGSSGPTQNAMRAGDDAAAIVGRATTEPAHQAGDFFQRVSDMWNATARVQQLESENRDLRSWKALAERLAERNARYEALLRMPPDDFGEGADVTHAIAAQLVLDSGGPFTRTLVANAGADHGVRVGFIAVNENGLVGRVVSVGRRSSRVLMLDDYNSRVPVMGEASRVRAVLSGQATQPPELLAAPFQVQTPRLDFIVGAQSLREGENVITSGDGGLYPRGLHVGAAHRDPDGAWRVRLAASQRPIDFVRLIPYVGAQTPESAPVADAGPPLTLGSSVASIGRNTMAPPPGAIALAPPRPRPPPAETTTTTAAAPTAATTTQPAPAHAPGHDESPPPPTPTTTTNAPAPG